MKRHRDPAVKSVWVAPHGVEVASSRPAGPWPTYAPAGTGVSISMVTVVPLLTDASGPTAPLAAVEITTHARTKPVEREAADH
jgi:hypothetical protein